MIKNLGNRGQPVTISKEELEINKYLDSKEDDKNEFDSLYDDIKQETKEEENTPEEVTEDIDADASEDDSLSAESFKNLYTDVSTEDMSDTVQYLKESLSSLAKLGLIYGPKVLSHAYKGVVSVIVRLINILYNSIVFVVKYRDRKINSFTNLKEYISEIKKSLDLVKVNEKDLSEIKYDKAKVINTLKIGSSVDFISNLVVLDSFMKNIISSISVKINNDIGYMKHVMHYSSMESARVPINTMTLNLNIDKVTTTTDLEEYEANSDLVKVTRYKDILPGDVVFISQLPNTSIDNIEDIAKAYNNSSIYLGFNSKGFKEVEYVNYMNAADLSNFLDKLDAICDIGLSHVNIYTDIINKKKSLRYSFRVYFNDIIKSTFRRSLENSFLNNVYLKSIFIDKVYIAGSMNVHDYCIKIVTSGLSFSKDNIKQLS